MVESDLSDDMCVADSLQSLDVELNVFSGR